MRVALKLVPLLLVVLIPACRYGSEARETSDSVRPRILVDGEFSDWESLAPTYIDSVAGDSANQVDFGRLWVTNDESFLIMRLEIGSERILQDRNDIVLYLDTDDDPTTGIPVHGIGAELRWEFGTREGEFLLGSDTARVEHQHIGLITAPTVSSTDFEIVLDRRAAPIPNVALFRGPSIRVVFTADPGDTLPDLEGGVGYSFDERPVAPVPPTSLAKQRADHVRMLGYNTSNRLLLPEQDSAYRRIIRAIAPDLLVLQEVRNHTSQEVLDHFMAMLPPSRSGTWYHARAGGEAIVVLSPFAIDGVYPLGGSAAFLLDLPAVFGKRFLVVGLSPPCCAHDRERQQEIDLIMAFLRDAKAPGGLVDLEPGTPIALVGDANLVGYVRQRRTLIEGAIADTARFGAAFAPDWDGTGLTDLAPRHTHRALTFTWYGESFPAGRLDYFIYSDAVLEVGNRFVLFTPDMPETTLAQYGLQRADSRTGSDHLPIVADFFLR